MNDDPKEKALENELREALNHPDQDQNQPTGIPAIEAVQATELALTTEQPVKNSAGVVILQWLSYTFWGWLAGGLVWLFSVILTSLVAGEDVSATVPYALAVSIVLLPVAFFVDLFYRRHEPIKKHGIAMVIMVIHAVIFALATIGTLIAAVFTALTMIINDQISFTNISSIVLYSTFFAAVIFGAIFLRILHPFKSHLFAKVFSFAVLALSLALIVIGFVGPAVNSYSLRSDRLIESGLPAVSTEIASYVTDNSRLPESLSDLKDLSGDGKKLVDQGLVSYKIVGKFTPSVSTDYPTYRYQLCVTYKKASSYSDTPYYSDSSSSSTYQSYPSTYGHKAGKVCYKLEAYLYTVEPAAATTTESNTGL